MNELIKTHRPKRFTDVIGQTEAVSILTKLVSKNKVPNCILFTGPSGTGKTTLARILAKKLGCGIHDLTEINCADFRGIDTVREIRSHVSLMPISGRCRVWILDEVGTLNKLTQNAFLKLLEEPPERAYFMLATTEPAKLLRTIKTRCTEIKCKNLEWKALQDLITKICKKEGIEISEEVRDKLIETADGSARKALVILHQISELDNEDEQLESIQSADSEKEAIELARALMRPNTQWKEIAKLLKEIDEEPESIRRLVLGYANAVALNGGGMASRALSIIDCFASPYYETGKAGLTWSCYHVMQTGRKK
jgi:DNA polymerase-3 subunit gamma/tau